MEYRIVYIIVLLVSHEPNINVNNPIWYGIYWLQKDILR
jgi:hypothetical protein